MCNSHNLTMKQTLSYPFGKELVSQNPDSHKFATECQIAECQAALILDKISTAWLLRQNYGRIPNDATFLQNIFAEFETNMGAPLLLYSLTRLLEWSGQDKNLPGRWPFNELSVTLLMNCLKMVCYAIEYEVNVDLAARLKTDSGVYHACSGKPAIQLVYELVCYVETNPHDPLINKFVYPASYGIVPCDVDNLTQTINRLWSIVKPLRKQVQQTLARQQNRFLCCCDMNALRATGSLGKKMACLTDINMFVTYAFEKQK